MTLANVLVLVIIFDALINFEMLALVYSKDFPLAH